ncbi:hypothetical protein E2C01_081240 [Portunus trituberculatus]|uniref:Uncharacterized protein n=1 Tax=Portunus trituberculatus TaxID=210409 RepID=A0A5B7J1S0_PORTR|nr:hypothetical protein [Portunus trituberculatus]
MRVGVIYVPRRPKKVIGALQLHSSTRQRSKHEVNGAQNTSISGRLMATEDRSCVSEEGSNTHTREPAAKVRRTVQKGDAASGSPDGRPGPFPVSATRTILQGVLSFFKRSEPSPSAPIASLSRLSFPLSLRSFFLGSLSEGQEKEQQQRELEQQKQQLLITGDTSENKENIPPTTREQTSTAATLRSFRHKSSLKRPRQKTDKPGTSRSAHREPTRSPTTASVSDTCL